MEFSEVSDLFSETWSKVDAQERSGRLCLSAMISLLRMRTSSTMSNRMSSTMYHAKSSSEMSSRSMSSLKSCPCRPPPIGEVYLEVELYPSVRGGFVAHC